jgi:hypothetical protein
MRMFDMFEKLLAEVRTKGIDTQNPAFEDIAVTWRLVQVLAMERVDDCLGDECGDVLTARYGMQRFGLSEPMSEREQRFVGEQLGAFCVSSDKVREVGDDQVFLDMTREFSLGGDVAEWDPAARLSCTFWFAASASPRGAGRGGVLRSPCPSLEVFFRRVLALRFQSGIRPRDGAAVRVGFRVVATKTIYIELLNEGVDVWRPVEATIEADDTFRLPDGAPEAEAWRFPPGSLVRCQVRRFSDGDGLAASERVV